MSEKNCSFCDHGPICLVYRQAKKTIKELDSSNNEIIGNGINNEGRYSGMNNCKFNIGKELSIVCLYYSENRKDE